MFIGFETVFSAKTFILAFTWNGDTDVLGIADEVLAGVAFVALLAEILSGSRDNGAEVIHTSEVFIGFETVGVAGAFIIPWSVYGDAGVALADVVLGAVVVRDAFVGSIAKDNDAGC